MNSEITKNICGGLVGILVYFIFLFWFGWTTWNSDFIFHGGRIRGKLARAIGIIGLVGMAAGTYLMISLFIFKTTPPLASLAGFLLGLFFVTMVVVRVLSIFMWHKK